MSILGARKLIVGLVAVASLLLAAPALASSVTFHVATTADGNQASPGTTSCATSAEGPTQGKCTLRSSIEAADNELAGTNVTIDVPEGTYKFSVQNEVCIAHCQGPNSYELEILSGPDSVTISGAGDSKTIVDANYLDRVFEITSGPTVKISGLTIEHGRPGGIGKTSGCPATDQPEEGGAGIRTSGVLTLAKDTLTDNVTSGGGGGLQDTGSENLKISGTTFSDNRACQPSGQFGTRNGGAIDVIGDSPVTIDSSVIAGNRALPDGNGGGIELENGGPTVQVSKTTVSGNKAFSGAGISNDAGGSGTYFADTLSGNQASNNGGGFADGNGGTEQFVDTTVAGNTASSDGGGFWMGGAATISFTTIVGNSSSSGTGNLTTGAESPGTIKVDDSIVASPSGGANCQSFGITDNGYNMFTGSASQCGFSTARHDVPTSSPKLGALADNGGPTQTVALLSGSPAVDAASTARCTSETKDSGGQQVDQRQIVTRPQGARCDIGAFEATPNLGLSAAVASSPINVGQQDTVTDTIDNLGPTDALNSTFTDPAAGYRIDSVKSSQGTCSHTATTVSCHLGTIPAGGKVTITIVLTGLSPGTITLKSKTDTSGIDLAPGNNHATVSITVKSKSKPPPPPPPPPKPAKPRISIDRLGPSCYRPHSTVHITAEAKAQAGLREVTITLAGHTIKYRFHGAKKATLKPSVQASALHPGHSYQVIAKATDRLGRSDSARASFTICKPSKRGFTG